MPLLFKSVKMSQPLPHPVFVIGLLFVAAQVGVAVLGSVLLQIVTGTLLFIASLRANNNALCKVLVLLEICEVQIKPLSVGIP